MDMNTSLQMETIGGANAIDCELRVNFPDGITDTERNELESVCEASTMHIQTIMNRIRLRLMKDAKIKAPTHDFAFAVESTAGRDVPHEPATDLRPERHNIAGVEVARTSWDVPKKDEPLLPGHKLEFEKPFSATKPKMGDKIYVSNELKVGEVIGISVFKEASTEFLVRYNGPSGEKREQWFKANCIVNAPAD